MAAEIDRSAGEGSGGERKAGQTETGRGAGRCHHCRGKGSVDVAIGNRHAAESVEHHAGIAAKEAEREDMAHFVKQDGDETDGHPDDLAGWAAAGVQKQEGDPEPELHPDGGAEQPEAPLAPAALRAIDNCRHRREPIIRLSWREITDSRMLTAVCHRMWGDGEPVYPGPNGRRPAVNGGATDFGARFVDAEDRPLKGFTISLSEVRQ